MCGRSLGSVADPCWEGWEQTKQTSASAAAACARGSGHLRPALHLCRKAAGEAHCSGTISCKVLGSFTLCSAHPSWKPAPMQKPDSALHVAQMCTVRAALLSVFRWFESLTWAALVTRSTRSQKPFNPWCLVQWECEPFPLHGSSW